MALNIEGRVIQITPIQKGEGSRGTWKKRFVVIETIETFSRKIAFLAWNEKAEMLNNLKVGQRVNINFSIESRLFNDRWYTDARLISLKIIKEESIEPSTKTNYEQERTNENITNNINTSEENNDWYKDDLDDALNENNELNNLEINLDDALNENNELNNLEINLDDALNENNELNNLEINMDDSKLDLNLEEGEDDDLPF